MRTAFDTGLGIPERCIVVGEVAQAHDGSLGAAHAYIDAIADAGADAVKFETHIAEAESSALEPWRTKFSLQDETRFDYWRRMEFAAEQWAGLKAHTEDRGLLFLSSPFSIEAADLLARIGIRAWKIASGEAGNTLLLRRIAETGLPVIVSTGMSALSETDQAVALFRSGGIPVTVLQCTSAYPCAPEHLGLNLLDRFRERYRCAVGLSDHSGTIFAGLAACALGAQMVEVHVTFSRDCFGPDVPASITTGELKTLVEGVRFIGKATGSSVEKDALTSELDPVRRIFTKSLTFRCDLPEGTRLSADHFSAKKPGTGIPVERVDRLVGRSLRRAVKLGAFVVEDDVLPG